MASFWIVHTSFCKNGGPGVILEGGLQDQNQKTARKGETPWPSNGVSIFANNASCLCLITTLLMETSDAWVVGRVYLSLTDT